MNASGKPGRLGLTFGAGEQIAITTTPTTTPSSSPRAYPSNLPSW